MKIGVFDSGIGGVTVLNQVVACLPSEYIVYLADSKYMPYGDKSFDFIKSRIYKMLNFFISHDCNTIFIACHSMASVYLQCMLKLRSIQMP